MDWNSRDMTKLETTTLRRESFEALREDVLGLIYGADWEIRGTLNDRVKDVVEHRMIDEERVFLDILGAIAARADIIVALIPPRRMEIALLKKKRTLNHLRRGREAEKEGRR